MKIERTVIGSFPLSSYPIEKAIENVVDLQLRYGIDIISDGELRGGIFDYFKQISGLDRKSKVVSEIRPMDKPDDFLRIIDYGTVKSYLAILNRRDVKIKIAMLGPITTSLAYLLDGLKYNPKLPTSHLLNPEYKKQKLYSDISEAILPLAKKCLEIGCYLQIDEPGISAYHTYPKFVRGILNEFFNSLPNKEGKVSIHLCGSITRQIYSELLELNLKTISLAFSEEKENINIISRKSLEDNQKMLGVGFISNINVEDEKTALERLIRIAEIVGLENIACVHPDCAFRNTSSEKIDLILENMKKASDAFMQ